MTTQPAFGFKELFAHVVGDMAKAICERNGETRQQQFARSEAAVHMIMGFLPRDVIEATLAGHCVMFHEVITDSVHDTLRGEVDTMRRGTRGNLVALNNAFWGNLDRLERYQLRLAEGRRDVPGVQTPDLGPEVRATPTPEPAAEAPPLAARTQPAPAGTLHAPVQTPPAPAQTLHASAGTPVRAPVLTPAQTPAQTMVAETRDVQAHAGAETIAVRLPETTVPYRPSAEAIAACRANPEAVAALDAGDPTRFARAMGIDMPSEAYLAAAGEGSIFASSGRVFDRQASRIPPREGAAGRPKA
jgi:hypothetical protein